MKHTLSLLVPLLACVVHAQSAWAPPAVDPDLNSPASGLQADLSAIAMTFRLPLEVF